MVYFLKFSGIPYYEQYNAINVWVSYNDRDDTGNGTDVGSSANIASGGANKFGFRHSDGTQMDLGSLMVVNGLADIWRGDSGGRPAGQPAEDCVMLHFVKTSVGDTTRRGGLDDQPCSLLAKSKHFCEYTPSAGK